MPPRSTCCAPCAREDAGDRITAIVRSVGSLVYPSGVEHVDASPASLGRPAMLIGLPVEHGRHGGPVVGRIVDARREGGALVAVMEIHDPEAREDMRDSEWSMDYETTVRADGVQLVSRFRAVASVPRSRCGAVCSTRADAAAVYVDPREAMIARHRVRHREAPIAPPTYQAPRVVIDRDGAFLAITTA